MRAGSVRARRQRTRWRRCSGRSSRIRHTPNPACSREFSAALTFQQGEFRRAETAALDVDSLSIAVALMDAHAAGTSVHGDWVRTVDAARAAQGDGTLPS